MAQPLETQAVTGDRPPQLLRGFSFRSALSLAFADVSPIAAVYAIFTLGLFAAGPKFFWAFPIVLVGQLLVAAVFGELARQRDRTRTHRHSPTRCRLTMACNGISNNDSQPAAHAAR
jgi:hypothetical protein